MTQVSRFKKLSPLMQKRVMQRLEEHGHGDFEVIAEELRAAGYRISKSSLHRFSQEMRSDAGFLQRWALAQPEQAAILVATLRRAPGFTLLANGGIEIIPADSLPGTTE